VRIKSTTAILFVIAIAIAIAAYAGDAGRPVQVAMGGDDTAKFFEEAASASKLEIETGRLAAHKATNPQLKAFGQQMVVDHTKASQELQTLAARKGMTLPLSMSDDDQKKLEKLREVKPGKDFDQEYRDLMIDCHEEAVSLFEDTAKDAKDPEVKAFATKMLPTLQHHEHQAKALPKA
jgi:putative membrane protein